MGILDDAIREHLDLKRRLGAAQDEIRRLEDEAFGPPTRPGDPDFPERPEGADGISTSEFAAGTQTAEAPGSAPEAPAEDRPLDAGGAEAAPFDATGGEEDDSRELEAAAAEAPPTAEAPVADPVAEPEPVVEPEPVAEPEPPPAPEPATEPPAAPEDEGSSELDLDLDLDLDDEAAEVVEPESGEDVVGDLPGTDEQPLLGEVEPAPEPEVPIESLDTVEHHFEEAIDEAEVVEEAEKEPAPAPAPTPETAGEEKEKASEDDEDVLEETPEFLRDNPDDDELWFEQGEPKDFDF